MAQPKDLYEFLAEAELQHYYNSFKNDLKITSIQQFKYVEEEDMVDMGMTKPEIRRLKKFFKKECPQGALGKIKKILIKTGGEGTGQPVTSPVGSKSPPPARSSSKHIIPTDAITKCKTLGTGEFGTVDQGVWTTEDGDRVQVAIKCLSKEKIQSGTSGFLKEATIMHTIDHDSIVRLYGVVLENDSLMLVTELAPLRSLLECLKEPTLRPSFPVTTLCDFSLQIAEGMNYLENKRLIHRDLSARNVLVFGKDKVKISDFGLSRALGVGQEYYQTNISVNLKLPIAWCAPECIHYSKFTSASDIWAYGVTLWEMFSYGFQPWAAFTGNQNSDIEKSGQFGENGHTTSIAQKILEAVDEPNNQRLEQPDYCPKEYYGIMLKCWEHSPERRIKFIELATMLPHLKPERVQCVKDYPYESPSKEHLYYRATDIITVLDKRPENPPEHDMWKGFLNTGKVGYFYSADAAPFIDIHTSPKHKVSRKISRKESARKSMGKAAVKRISASMISRPQNDLRHTGHIGYDGAVFGDVSFIGDNYDKLPVKVVNPYKPSDDMTSSTCSIGDDLDQGSMYYSQSEVSLASSNWTGISSTTKGSWSDKGSNGTLTDVSSYQGDGESIMKWKAEEKHSPDDFGDDLDFDSFKMPDLSLSFDMGGSFMDEMMQALNDTTNKANLDEPAAVETLPNLNNRMEDLKSPLIEKNDPFSQQRSTFDNFGLTTDGDMDNVSERTMSQENSGFDAHVSSAPIAQSESDFSLTHGEGTRAKPKLKLVIPSMEGYGKDSKKHAKVKPMSASDEKKIDLAITLANEFAQISTQDHVASPEPRVEDTPNDQEVPPESPNVRSLFNLRSKRSPKQERKSFTEEIASKGDFNEDLTPEAQQAYNVLVVKGAAKDNADNAAKHSIRDRRMRRALEHQNKGDEPTNGPDGSDGMKTTNIREPQGIPGRRMSARTTDTNGTENNGEVETNPLRRLRESQSSVVPSRPRGRPPNIPGITDTKVPTEKTDISNGQSYGSYRTDYRRPYLASRNQLVNKYRSDDTTKMTQVGIAEPQPRMSHHDNENSPENLVPLPPREPLKQKTINQPPRERKFPLDMSDCNTVSQAQSDKINSKDSYKQNSSSSLDEPNDIKQVNEDFSETGKALLSGRKKTSSYRLQTALPHSQFCVKNVSLSAEDLGLFDDTDPFWLKEVNFGDLSGSCQSDEEGQEEVEPIPGRYKTSDSVSYEDLLDFALDGPDPSSPMETQSTCDEIRLMRKVLTSDVTIEDCMMALQETQWEVHNGIKYLKLKQLLSVNLSDKENCKSALIDASWDVEDAANNLLAPPSGTGRDSPECVNV